MGVSVSTVSKALRDNEEISLETRQRIQAYAKYFNYKPNRIALNLRNQSTRSIAIIIPQIVNHFFTKVIQGIESEANKRDYNVIIAVSNDSLEKEALNMETLANGSIDGFILSVAKETLFKKDYSHFNEAVSQGIPIVMFDRVADCMDCDKVIVNDCESTRMATKKLLKTGSKKIVFISTEDFVTVGKLRKEGFIQALEENHIPVDERLIIHVKDIFTPGEVELFIREKLDEISNEHKDIDGVMGVNEIYTAIAVNYFIEKGLKIPEDISAISFSDGDLPKYSFPGITAIRQDGEKIGETAAKLLLDKLEGKSKEEDFQTVIIETELIERESTR